MQNACYLVLTTFSDLDSAEQFAQQVVIKKLAACVNISPQLRSIYCWQGKIESGKDV
jgi:periplasmic divalent cation tolerance protein